uniref:Uncharacterized protein n=1 Tax=Myripristis murdjan TaxID=586833 RepID=A0A668A5N4_9TELE
CPWNSVLLFPLVRGISLPSSVKVGFSERLSLRGGDSLCSKRLSLRGGDSLCLKRLSLCGGDSLSSKRLVLRAGVDKGKPPEDRAPAPLKGVDGSAR